ncbi:MAG: hypothetical protein HC789_03340 [Microcoleus sp. CSU_2_2]|nr:hypothetical protein [Microcoleus sp. CSU_2_2]
MIQEENQQPQVSLEISSENADLEKTAATTQELPENVEPSNQSQVVKNDGEDGLKALARLVMVSLTWSLAGLSKRK